MWVNLIITALTMYHGGQMDRQMGGKTDGQTNGWKDRWTGILQSVSVGQK